VVLRKREVRSLLRGFVRSSPLRFLPSVHNFFSTFPFPSPASSKDTNHGFLRPGTHLLHECRKPTSEPGRLATQEEHPNWNGQKLGLFFPFRRGSSTKKATSQTKKSRAAIEPPRVALPTFPSPFSLARERGHVVPDALVSLAWMKRGRLERGERGQHKQRKKRGRITTAARR